MARRLTDRTLDLDTLEVFRAVATAGSLTAAAQVLGITQQAVSARIGAAERSLKLALVVRTSTGSRLTDAGAVLLDLAAPVLDAAARLETGLDALRRPAGTLTVAASQTIAELLLPDWLQQLRARSPELTVRLVAGNSAEVNAQIRAGAADLGFIEGPQDADGLRSTPVATDELVVVVAPGHRWAGRASISAAELAATGLLVREEGSGTRAVLESRLAESGLTLHPPAAEFAVTAVIRANARAAVAPAVLSIRSVSADLQAGTLIRVPLDGPPLHRTFTAIWSGEPTPAARALLDQILEHD